MLCHCVMTDITIQGENQKYKETITVKEKALLENNLEF